MKADLEGGELRVYENSVGTWNVQLDADLSDDRVRHGKCGSKTRRAAIRHAVKELTRKARHYRAVLRAELEGRP